MHRYAIYSRSYSSTAPTPLIRKMAGREANNPNNARDPFFSVIKRNQSSGNVRLLRPTAMLVPTAAAWRSVNPVSTLATGPLELIAEVLSIPRCSRHSCDLTSFWAGMRTTPSRYDDGWPTPLERSLLHTAPEALPPVVLKLQLHANATSRHQFHGDERCSPVHTPQANNRCSTMDPLESSFSQVSERIKLCGLLGSLRGWPPSRLALGLPWAFSI